MMYPTKLTLAFMLLLPITACDLDALPTSDRAALSASEDDARPDHRPPPLVLLELAVDRGDLNDDPAMLDALGAMAGAHTEAIAARGDLMQALADAVATGTVTREAFTTQLAAITRTAAAQGTALTAALDTAHEQLDADLRAEVIDAMPEPPPRPEAGQAPPSGDRPSGDRPSGPPPPGEQQPPPGAGPRGPGPMALLEALALDDDQQQALRDALGEPARPQRPEPLDLALFAEDDFDAASLGLADVHAAHLTEEATRHVELLVALVPLLDDDQRATLEGLLRDGPREPTRSARG